MPCFAGLTSISPQLTARPRTWRSACVASKRCPPAMFMRQVAISAGANLVDPPVSEGPHRLREQPAQLRHGLRLAAVLRQVEIDELTQPWCLDEALLAP